MTNEHATDREVGFAEVPGAMLVALEADGGDGRTAIARLYLADALRRALAKPAAKRAADEVQS